MTHISVDTPSAETDRAQRAPDSRRLLPTPTSVFQAKARLFAALSPFALALLSACGDDASSQDDSSGEAGMFIGSSTTDAATPFDAGCQNGNTQSCACEDGGVGRQSCIDGVFSGACNQCQERSVMSSSKCVAGRYEGTFDVPYYAPQPAGFCGLFTLFGGPGFGGWSFSLGESGSGEFLNVVESSGCVELTTVTVDGGVGSDGDAATNPPLLLELSGSVDCATGEFKGLIRGTYRSVGFCDLGMMENDYFIKGPVTATFDVATQSFVNGTAELREPPVPFPLGGEPGGSGTWRAERKPNAQAPGVPDGGCLGGVTFRDELFP